MMHLPPLWGFGCGETQRFYTPAAPLGLELCRMIKQSYTLRWVLLRFLFQ